MNDWLDIEQLSRYLSIKSKTLYSMVRSGKIPSFKVGRMLRFKKSEIDEWMERHRHVAPPVSTDARKRLVGKGASNEEIKTIAGEAVASVIDQNRKKQPDKGAIKENDYGNL